MSLINFAEHRWVPDTGIRYGIRRLLRQRLASESINTVDEQDDSILSERIAIETAAANQQHYELPAEFFQHALGSRLKYSACWWDKNCNDLNSAETAMLDIYLQRADIRDGQKILELGCGWGSFCLYAASKFPNASITAVSNSHSQREHVLSQAKQLGLNNIQVITKDINELELETQFDRIVSVEMFEHMRNHERLFSKLDSWLDKQGKLFVHVFCHKTLCYPFDTNGEDNWMGRYFFTGGIMPASDTLIRCQNHLKIEHQWAVNGSHYQKTAEAWLNNLDNTKALVLPVLINTYGKQEAQIWLQRWRMFFMACAELFGYADGNEWLVTHYLFSKSEKNIT